MYYSDDQKRGQTAVENFHQLYDEGKFEEIFQNADPEVKATKSKDDLLELLEGMRDSVKSRTLIWKMRR